MPGHVLRMDVLFWGLSNKLLKQGYVMKRLKSSFGKSYSRYRDLSKQSEVPPLQVLNNIQEMIKIRWHTIDKISKTFTYFDFFDRLHNHFSPTTQPESHHSQNCTGKIFRTDSRHFNGQKSCPSPSKYLGHMYPTEFEIKDTTKSRIQCITSDYFLDWLLSIRRNFLLRTFLNHKHDDFKFHITNSPFLISNIQSSPAYGFLSHSSLDMSGLAPLINILLWMWCDLQISIGICEGMFQNVS